jgi:hypothetical protein
MTRLAVTYPDAERLVVDYLTPLLDESVGVGVPAGWTATSPDHLQVVLDGTPRLEHPVIAHATIRLVARSASTTRAKALASKAMGLLCAHPSDDSIAGTGPYTGVLPARDPETGAELASVTCRVTVRSTPIP